MISSLLMENLVTWCNNNHLLLHDNKNHGPCGGLQRFKYRYYCSEALKLDPSDTKSTRQRNNQQKTRGDNTLNSFSYNLDVYKCGLKVTAALCECLERKENQMNLMEYRSSAVSYEQNALMMCWSERSYKSSLSVMWRGRTEQCLLEAGIKGVKETQQQWETQSEMWQVIQNMTGFCFF